MSSMSSARARPATRLSPRQRQLWTPESPQTAVSSCVLRVDGAIPSSHLRDAWIALAARHEMLRVVLRQRPGLRLPLVTVVPDARIAWREVAGHAADDAMRAVEDVLREQRAEPFDWQNGPLLRIALLDPGGSTRRLCVTMPALCADAASCARLAEAWARDLLALTGAAAPDPPATPFMDFAGWHHDLLATDDEETTASGAFWREQAATMPMARLPWERAADTPGDWHVVSTEIDGAVVARLDPFATVSPPARRDLLLAAWIAWLWRVTGDTPVRTGILGDGRQHAALRDTIGPLSTPLPLSCGLHRGDRLADIAQRAAGTMRVAAARQHYYRADPSSAVAAFEFDYVELPGRFTNGASSIAVTDARTTPEAGTGRLQVLDGADGITLRLWYRGGRLHATDAACALRTYRTLLEAGIAQPDTAVERLPMLTEAQRSHATRPSEGSTIPAAPAAPSVAAQVHAHARRQPSRPAVICGDETLTYAELDARARQLAAALRAHGVHGNERLVGLHVTRSPDAIVGLLGVLYAGGAYVAVSTDQPPARAAAQLAASRATLLVTDAASHALAQAHATSSGFDGAVLFVDRPLAGADAGVDAGADAGADADDGDRAWREAVPAAVRPDQLAYALFTSGSTAAQKLVGVTHGSLAAYTQALRDVLWSGDADGDEPPAQFAMVSTHCADLGHTCLYPALASGGCLHLVPFDVATDGSQLSAYVDRHGIDVMKIVPSHLQAVLASAGAGARVALPRRWLVLGGEAFPTSLRDTLTQLHPSCRILNHYGPTETTVGSLVHPVPPPAERDDDGPTVPLGRPIRGTWASVLDAYGEPVPDGVTGELYIGGAGVARGYLHAPAQTASRFLPDPWSTTPGARRYRSGDLVRRGRDGRITFIGRADTQVKVRGFRVELAEIEDALRRHPAVRDAAVVTRVEASGGIGLAAWVLPAPGQEPTGAELRRFLQELVPDYMAPSVILCRQAWPLTPNGKLARAQLADEASTMAEMGHGRRRTPPRTATEEIVAGVWSALLGVAEPGVEDSFFDLGGHSLLATQVISRVRELFDVEAPLQTLFEHPRLDAFAAEIDARQRARDGLPMPLLTGAPRPAVVPLSFAQRRIWFFEQLAPGSPSYIVPAAVRLQGDLRVDLLHRCLQDVVSRHEVLRTRFVADGREPRQIALPDVRLPLDATDLTAMPAADRHDEMRRLAGAVVRQPFALDEAPLLRAHLVRLGPDEHVLVLAMHHIVCDGWSIGVLVRDVTRAYEARCDGRTPDLPALPCQYADFALWQRAWLQGETLDRQLAYWRARLQDVPSTLPLRTDRPRPAHQTFAGAYETFLVDPPLTAALKAVARREGVTLFMVLLAAFKTLLYRCTGQDDLVVGTGIANRTRTEVESLIGFFVNTLVLRTSLAGQPSFRTLLARVRDTTLGAYAHQDLPFERLVEALAPVREAGRHPFFQVLFHLQNFPMTPLALPGLVVTPMEAPNGGVNFDLTLSMGERDEGLRATMDYNTDLFDRETVQTLVWRLQRLLRAVPDHLETPLLDIPLGDEREAAARVEPAMDLERDQFVFFPA
jgi:amino acid adenylation domain-containing protein